MICWKIILCTILENGTLYHSERYYFILYWREISHYAKRCWLTKVLENINFAKIFEGVSLAKVLKNVGFTMY